MYGHLKNISSENFTSLNLNKEFIYVIDPVNLLCKVFQDVCHALTHLYYRSVLTVYWTQRHPLWTQSNCRSISI